ncbi:MAG: hypothetical protein Hyperionvirus11_25 [Hyperionvirus sp.]|uniref:TRAF-type domain-containing protein n=1 Tax=Hyperionvirus sp. TaxID=2487770 RepID=A0A3G5A9J3_9VIRU|nr:MAG: hypothetical protein Hyperionvirus11_25 [Hyperionvirus sp.]
MAAAAASGRHKYHGDYNCRAAPLCDFKNKNLAPVLKHQDDCDKFVCRQSIFGCKVAGKFALVREHVCDFAACKNVQCSVGGDVKMIETHMKECAWRRVRCKYCWSVEPFCTLLKHQEKCLTEETKCRCCSEIMTRTKFINEHYKICTENFFAARKTLDELLGKDTMNDYIAEIENDFQEESFAYGWLTRLPYSPGDMKIVFAVLKFRDDYHETRTIVKQIKPYLSLLPKLKDL